MRHIGIAGSRLRLTRAADGWYVQQASLAGGTVAADAPPPGLRQLPIGDDLDVRLDDVVLEYDDQRAGRELLSFNIDTAGLEVAGTAIQVDTTLRGIGDEALRAGVLLSGRLPARTVAGLRAGDWSISADLDAVSASLVRALLPAEWGLPSAGNADLLVDAKVVAGSLAAAVLSIDANRLVPPGGGEQSAVAGQLEWSRSDDGWLCAVSNFEVAVADRRWPAASMLLNLSQDDEATVLNLSTANVTVYDLPYLASFLPANAARALLATELSGTLVSVEGLFSFVPDKPLAALGFDDLREYEVDAEFNGLSVAATARLPGVRNMSGTLRVSDDAGRIAIDASDAALVMPRVFRQPLELDRLRGTVVWRDNDRGVSVLSDAIRIETAALTADSSLELLLGADDGGPIIDVQSTFSVADLSAIDGLLPTALLTPKLAAWLSRAFEAGRITDGEFELRGDLSKFPFSDGDGVFRASAEAEGMTMRYSPKWPAIERASASVRLDGLRLFTRTNQGLSGGLPFRDARVAFDNLRESVLTLSTSGASTLAQLYTYAADSPLRGLFGNQFDNIALDGDATYNVELTVPLKALREFDVDARITTGNARFGLRFLPFDLQQIDGVVRVDRQGVHAEAVQAQLLGGAVSIDMAPITDEPGYSTMITGEGMLRADAMADAMPLPLLQRLTGQAPFTTKVRLPRSVPGQAPAPVEIGITSDLAGVAIDMPYPLGKDAEADSPHRLQLSIADSLTARFSAGELIDVAAVLARDATSEPLQLDRATVHLGEGRALLPSVSGLFIDGGIDRLRLDDWLSLNLAGGGLVADNLKSVAIDVTDFYAFGQRVANVRASLKRASDNWLVDVQSEAIEGVISVPVDLSLGEPVVLEMSRLKLLEADPQASGSADPTRLPPLRIRAAEFALGDREFGALEADIVKVSDGLSATRIRTAAEAFSIDASGQWLTDPVETAGSRTTLSATVTSNDVERMMNQLGYAPGINAASLNSELDVSWAGGPGKDFVASLDGAVSLSINNGTLDEVEPGAGRVVGLMSVAELPRRLALDFRDVFQKGFKFDEIVGDFRLVNGDAYTCNLSLKGSSADVGLVGRASLDKRNYNQTAVVSVKVGNTLPAVGAVVAGPQVGAALLLFSQIFKKPLRGMTEVYYQINGSWDEPSIDRTDVARFVATSELAGCLVNNGG